jgi:hypothetical protein
MPLNLTPIFLKCEIRQPPAAEPGALSAATVAVVQLATRYTNLRSEECRTFKSIWKPISRCTAWRRKAYDSSSRNNENEAQPASSDPNWHATATCPAKVRSVTALLGGERRVGILSQRRKMSSAPWKSDTWRSQLHTSRAKLNFCSNLSFPMPGLTA